MKFDYKVATAEQIADYFNKASRATISAVRKRYKNDAEMSCKIERAYVAYKRARNGMIVDRPTSDEGQAE